MAVVKKMLPSGTKKKSLKKAASAPTDVTLPTEMEGPSERLSDYSILIFGTKKIGKSTLASMFPKTLMLMFEPGGKGLTAFKRPVRSWQEARQYLKLIKKDTTFDNVAIDTVDVAYKQCDKFVCQKMGIDHPSEADWGKGWSGVRDEFEWWTRELMASGKGVMFISHSVEKEIRKRNQQNYHRIQPTMANIGRDVIESMVDIWCYYDYEEGVRTLTIRGDDHITAGHRLQDRFLTPDGKELLTINMGTSKEQAYANFIAAFNNEYVPPVESTDDTPKKKFKIKKKAAA